MIDEKESVFRITKEDAQNFEKTIEAMMKMKDKEQFKLCYVKEPFAYFTTAPLEKQWGDDWNDRPYEHNAEPPYEYDERDKCEPYEIKKLAYEGDLIEPSYGHCNSNWSVEEINAGNIPWLRSACWSDTSVAIFAGTTIAAFIKIVQEDGGKIYLLEEKADA